MNSDMAYDELREAQEDLSEAYETMDRGCIERAQARYDKIEEALCEHNRRFAGRELGI